MPQQLEELIRIPNTLSLLVFCIDGRSELRYYYDCFDDTILIQREDPNTICSQVTSSKGFERKIFYSCTSQNRRLLTMTGYARDFPVEVYSWKAREAPVMIRPEERECIDILASIEMTHVAGSERALAAHQEKSRGRTLLPVALSQAQEVYRAMQWHVPRI